jgi:uncharacterized integral membrane protein (TIGR00698 family)
MSTQADQSIAGHRMLRVLPGLSLAIAIALAAMEVRRATGLDAMNPMAVALLLGIVFRLAVGAPRVLNDGIAYAIRPFLRMAIVLLGLQLSLVQLWQIGPAALALAAAAVILTWAATMLMARLLKVDSDLAALIAAGTSICGASAIVAANDMIKAKEENVAYSLAVITLFGTAAMLVLPMFPKLLSLTDRQFGLWAGISIHEVVQAIGAAAARGPTAAETGIVAKLARVILLGPALLMAGAWIKLRKSGGQAQATTKFNFPWFAVWFLVLVAIGSVAQVPDWVIQASRLATPVMLSASVGALGLSTDLTALKERGLAPILLGAFSTAFISLLALLGIRLLT